MRPAEAAARREKARREEAERLDAEILTAIGRGWSDPLADAEFDRLARDIFAHQFRFNPAYRKFCEARGLGAPADATRWQEIPTVPTGAFKVGRWTTFPEDRESAAFRTSGTTSGAAGIHRFETLGLMNAANVASGRRNLLPDLDQIRCLFLSPPPSVARDSSLVHMLAVFREAFGGPGSGFLLDGPPATGMLRPEAIAQALDRAVESGEPVLVAGAALAFHNVLSALRGAWELPDGSRAMTTGGYKGVQTFADPGELGAMIESRLGIPPGRQIEEYGMTELSSQYYARDRREGFHAPPWTRVRIVDPLTGEEVEPGAEGALVHVDLANRASAVAVLTSDLGTATGPTSFRLTGREPGAEARGCSLAADLWTGPA